MKLARGPQFSNESDYACLAGREDPSEDLRRASARKAQAIGVLAPLLADVVDQPWRRAEALVEEFGSIGAALKGSAARVGRIAGENAFAALSKIDEAFRFLLREEIEARPTISNSDELIKYIAPSMQHLVVEEMRVLYFNARGGLIKEESLCEGTTSCAPISIRKLLSRCLDLGSNAIILVHNHPSGDPSPSKSDVECTEAIVEAARALEIKVHDHLIIGAGRYVSLRSTGVL